MVKYSIFVLTTVLFSQIVLGQEATESDVDFAGIYGDENYVSIATGSVQPIAKAPAVASVITAKQIKASGAKDIDQILEAVPGLHVSRDVIGYNPFYVFRGVYAGFNPQVLMLINGIPITNLFQGDRNVVWGGMPVEAISRIEVIRGPGSALYGADAFAGVINIVTKGPDEIAKNLAGLGFGSNATKNVWLSTTGKKNNVAMSAILELSKTDGSDRLIESDAQSLLDFLTGTRVSAAPGKLNRSGEAADLRTEASYKNWRLRFGGQLRNNIGDGAGAAEVINLDNKFASKRFNIDLTYVEEKLFEDTSLEFQASYFDTTQQVEGDFVLYPAGSTGPFLDASLRPLFPPFPDGVIGTPEIFENHMRLGLHVGYKGIDKHLLTVGTGYYEGEIDKVTEMRNFGINPATGQIILPGEPQVDISDTPYVFITEGERKNYYLYLQDVWLIGNDWELTAGLRHDDYSDFGTTTNPRMALVWSTSYNLTTKFLYGQAFRAPSFAQTRAINNPLILGNINLKPEEIESFEVAFDYRPTYQLIVNTNFFYYDWKNIIQFVPDANGSTRTAQNAGQQTGHGVEFEVNWTASSSLTVVSNFSLQKSKDALVNRPAANSPEKQFYARADWQLPEDWRMNVQFNWVMDRNRASGDPRPMIADYKTVDLTLRKILSESFELGFIVNNAFDEDAREPSPNSDPVPFIPNDLPLPGRTFLAEVRYSF